MAPNLTTFLFFLTFLEVNFVASSLDYQSTPSFEDEKYLSTAENLQTSANLSGTKLDQLEASDLSGSNLEVDFANLPSNLVELDLSGKRIKHLGDGIFANLTKLKSLNVTSNLLQNLLFRNKALLHLDASRNPLVLDRVVTGFPALKRLGISWSNLTNVVENVFADLTNLEDLDLSWNKLVVLPGGVFRNLTQLKTLDLQGNGLGTIPKGLLGANVNLERVNLRKNRLVSIGSHAFHRNVNLRELDLSSNDFALTEKEIALGISPFHANLKLVKLDLSGNKIGQISEDWIVSLVHLRLLDLSYNHITSIEFSDFAGVSSNLSIDLSHNSIETVDFRLSNAVDVAADGLSARQVNLNGNPVICDCRIHDFVRYFDGTANRLVQETIKIKADDLRCLIPSNLAGQLVAQLKPDALTCHVDNCPSPCSCHYKSWTNLLLVDCSHKNLTQVPTLALPTFHNHTTIVNLTGNRLRQAPGEGFGYQKVQVLDLSSNNITELTWVPQNLKALDVSGNQLEHLGEKVLLGINSAPIGNLVLGNNPWVCGCSAINLRRFMISHLISKRMIDAGNVKCKKDGRLVIHLTANDVCLTFSSLIVTCSLFLAVMASSISVLTCLCAFTKRKRTYTKF